MEPQAFTAMVAAAAGAMVTWLTFRRQHSGSAASTDADRLWTANETLLNAYVGDNSRLRDQVQKLEASERECHDRYRDLELRLTQKEMDVIKLQEQVRALMEAATSDEREKAAAL